MGSIHCLYICFQAIQPPRCPHRLSGILPVHLQRSPPHRVKELERPLTHSTDGLCGGIPSYWLAFFLASSSTNMAPLNVHIRHHSTGGSHRSAGNPLPFHRFAPPVFLPGSLTWLENRASSPVARRASWCSSRVQASG